MVKINIIMLINFFIKIYTGLIG